MLLVAAGFMISSASFIFTGCTKEGPQGVAGTNGTNGTNGIDANATCLQCHNFSDTIVTKIFQYDASQHATGSTTFEGTRKECATCHTSQGFVEVAASGSDTTANIVNDAAPINCRTCHQIHNTFTNKDWALEITSAFHPRFDKTKTVDLAVNGGQSNLCGRCHQARAAKPALTNPASTDVLQISSSRWGPHHGTQSLILSGMGAYQLGSATYGTSPHKDRASCSTCHSGYPQGDLVGGHTLHMTNDEVGDNVNVCKTCHSSINNSFDLNGKQTEIENSMEELKVLLAAANMMDTTTFLLKPGTYPQNKLAAFWNYQLILADRSNGVHNYAYTRDVLIASKAVFAK